MSETALIIGGSSGMGLETARMMHKRGVSQILVSSSDAKLAKAKDLFHGGPSVETWQADLASPDGFRSIVERVENLDEGVSLKYLLFAAGFPIFAPFVDFKEEDFDKYSYMNKSLFFISQAAARRMKKAGGGSIVNIGTILSEQANAQAPVSAYVFSKGGMVSLTRQLASELAADNIRVNCVLPGAVDSAIFSSMPREELQKMLDTWAKMHLLGRVGQPEEVARVINFLLMDASWVTGALWNVDGGMLAGRTA